jgi:hypothetical protein
MDKKQVPHICSICGADFSDANDGAILAKQCQKQGKPQSPFSRFEAITVTVTHERNKHFDTWTTIIEMGEIRTEERTHIMRYKFERGPIKVKKFDKPEEIFYGGEKGSRIVEATFEDIMSLLLTPWNYVK